jgi:threonine/homoserine/homoserine lactone efflux protein
MPKALCITGMVVSILVLILFLADLILPASTGLAPFKKASWMLDIVFVLCAAVLAYMSWSTLKEQV